MTKPEFASNIICSHPLKGHEKKGKCDEKCKHATSQIQKLGISRVWLMFIVEDGSLARHNTSFSSVILAQTLIQHHFVICQWGNSCLEMREMRQDAIQYQYKEAHVLKTTIHSKQ